MLKKTHPKLLDYAKYFENKDTFSFQKALKIRVSLVRFQSRPPNKNRCFRKRATVFSLSERRFIRQPYAAGTFPLRCCRFVL